MIKGCYVPGEGIANTGPSAYSTAHEYAHLRQETENGLLWRWRMRTAHVPVISHIMLLLVEMQAACMGVTCLVQCGCLDQLDVREAWIGLKSYLRAIFR